MRRSRAALGLGGLLAALGLAAAGCVGGEDGHSPLAQARTGAQEIAGLVDEGEMDLARERFFEAHEPLHRTATALEPSDRRLAEVLNDITEVMQERFLSEPIDQREMSELAQRTLDLLDDAAALLEG